MTSLPSSFPMTSCPLCPVTVEVGKCGISSYGMVTACSISAPNTPNPDPKMKPIVGRMVIFFSIYVDASSMMFFIVFRPFLWIEYLVKSSSQTQAFGYESSLHSFHRCRRMFYVYVFVFHS